MTSQNTKKPDYILVVRSENLPLLDIYFENLKALGVTFQNVPGVVSPNYLLSRKLY